MNLYKRRKGKKFIICFAKSPICTTFAINSFRAQNGETVSLKRTLKENEDKEIKYRKIIDNELRRRT